eukprot:GGOE01045305.1.p1 GENE.GGOE01045305.1~~GGOE01045305.1.p1  ORF type:complete len:291 (+),score=46.94 GGOE01045305.1:332-1204(+)
MVRFPDVAPPAIFSSSNTSHLPPKPASPEHKLTASLRHPGMPTQADVQVQPVACVAGMQPACQNRGTAWLRIACVGDSLTAHHRHGQAYPWHMERYLRQLLPNVTVGNFGKASATAMLNTDRPYVQSSDWPRLAEFQPQIVVVLLGINDSKRRNWLRAGGAKQFYEELRTLVLGFKNKSIDVVLGQPYRGYKEYAEIQWNIVMGTVNPLIRQIACELHLPLFALAPIIAKSKFTYTDGVHPTEKGRMAMGRLVADTIQSCLRGRSVFRPATCGDFRGWEETCETIKPATP